MTENVFYLTNDILLLKEKDTDSHWPILGTIAPSDMSRTERRSFLNAEAKQEGRSEEGISKD